MLDYEKPALEVGQYKVRIKQSIKGSGISTDFAEKTNEFIVTGDRFTLNQSSIHACFPPEGSLGRHTDVLPHISLKRSTFPWERSAYGNEDYEPWLTLLLFDEEELATGDVIEQTLTLGELNGAKVKLLDETEHNAFFSRITLEQGQLVNDKVQVINVKRSLLEKLIPSGNVLKQLSHVRKRTGDGDDIELAVTVANRLPKEGSESSVYLVSVEERYKDDRSFDYGDSSQEDYIRLVVLKKWGFACLPADGKTFEELVEDISTGPLSLPRKNSSTPDSSTLDSYLEAGYVPLPHRLRQCDRTHSWYHGPLIPQEISAEFTSDEQLPEFADALIRYHQNIGMFDVSYAAAFELGRMLALTDSRFAAALYQWKQRYNEFVLAKEELDNAKTLMDTSGLQSIDDEELRAPITQWMTNLRNLVNVPFSYLIPDDTLLPEEAIRFFKLDPHWTESLLYGAFSIGGSVRMTSEKSLTDVFKGFQLETSQLPISGFIIRSQLISGYPDIQADAFPEAYPNKDPLPKDAAILNALRIDRIRPDVMIGLFEGDISTLELYLKPQGLKFGLDVESDEQDNDVLSKDLEVRNNDGSYTKTTITPVNSSAWWSYPEKRILNIDTLAQDIKTELGLTGTNDLNAAVFAMQMLEGSNKGRFIVQQSQLQ